MNGSQPVREPASPFQAWMLLPAFSLLLVTASALECNQGCVARGNCNWELGECQCPFGWRGAACEEALLPACGYNATGPMPTALGKYLPRNCECFKQVHTHFKCTSADSGCEHGIYTNHDSTCYTIDGLPAEQQYSRMPAVNETGVSWFKLQGVGQPLKPLSEAQGRVTLDRSGRTEVGMPLQACMESCNYHGICLFARGSPTAKQGLCHCQKGWQGYSCAEVDASLCPNRCQEKGKCVGGFCHCQAPFWGLDCGLSPARFQAHAAVTNRSRIPSRTRLAIYVYELPHWVSSPVALDDHHDDRVTSYMAYTQFHEQMLADWAVRVLDPHIANMFYIPAHVYAFSSNLQTPEPHLRRVFNYVQQTWPFFNQSNGKDHFVWIPGDRGSCYVSPTLPPVIKITHFGYHRNRKTRPTGNPIVTGSLYPQPADPYTGCFQPMRDVIAPPLFHASVNSSAVYAQVVASQGVDVNRTLLFFFAGSVRGGDLSYSGGARQRVQKLLLDLRNSTTTNLSDIQFVEGKTSNFGLWHETSKFCLAPHGSGYGMRMTIAMQYACIPVIISDLVVQPLDNVLPYAEFSVRVPNRDLGQLVDILRSITQEEQNTLRLGMARYYQAFLWPREAHGKAYHWTLKALHQRLTNLWGDLYRR